MKIVACLFIFFIFIQPLSSQENTSSKRGTIKVRKTGQLMKVGYDHVNYRLIGIDRFGNILDSAVVEFQMSVTIQGIFYTEKATGPNLTFEMQQLLEKCDRGTFLFFKNIKAKERNGTIIEIPKFQYTLGDYDN